MKKEMIQKLQNHFDALSQNIPEEGVQRLTGSIADAAAD